jgi:hypothetical protein
MPGAGEGETVGAKPSHTFLKGGAADGRDGSGPMSGWDTTRCPFI